MARAERISIDEGFVSRLLLGTLTEHEQRLLAIRLLEVDLAFRINVLTMVRPFEMFDVDLAGEFADVLDRRDDDPRLDVGRARRVILARAHHRVPNLGALLDQFTITDWLSLGKVTRKIFTWTMAEYLLERSHKRRQGSFRIRTDLYLATMVIDVVDLLGTSGHSPHYPAVVANVRRRILARGANSS